jgi:tetratricopeptide (TPR) repeat protein
MKNHTLIILLLVLLVTTSASAALTNEQLNDLALDAHLLFRQGNQQAQQGSPQAEQLYDQAILHFQKIIDEGPVANPYLYYNIANAHLLKGDIGRAILNYRRAEQLGSSEPDLQKNLTFARTKRIDKIPVPTEKRVLQTLFFWHYDLAEKTRFFIACLCWTIACLAAAAMLFSSRLRWLRIPLALAMLLLICLTASLTLNAYHRRANPQGVIIARSIIARQGDGEIYQPSFAEPLHSGTEFHLIKRQLDWLHIKLDNGTNTWIPTTAAEII